MFNSILPAHLQRCYPSACENFMIMMNTLLRAGIDQIQYMIDMVSGRNRNRGMGFAILDFPPELLEKVFGSVDFQCKRNCRLVHNYWRAVIDHNFMKFKIDTRDEKRSVHGIETLRASQQYFEKVTISFLWGRTCLIIPTSIQKYHPFPQIKKLVFGGYGPSEDRMDYVVECFGIGRKRTATKSPTPSLPQLRELLKFVFHLVRGGVEYLSIDLRDLAIIVPEMKSTLSNVAWNSLRKLRLCTSPRENSCLFGVMKFAKIPILSEFEIDIFHSLVSTNRQLEQERYILTAFIVDMCHFLLNHKETLRTVKCGIDTVSGHPDFEEEIAFIHGQLKLEHCQVKMSEQYVRGRIEFGFVAIALTKGLSSLRSFELANDFDYLYVDDNYNCKLQNDLKEVLRKNGPTLENLSLGFSKVSWDLLEHCTKLKSVKFGLSQELLEGERTLHLESVEEFTITYDLTLEEKFAPWVVKHMPNLKVITIQQCELDAYVDDLEILMELEFLREIKIQGVDVILDMESYCNGSVGLTYKKHENANDVRDYPERPFGFIDDEWTYSASIFIDRSP